MSLCLIRKAILFVCAGGNVHELIVTVVVVVVYNEGEALTRIISARLVTTREAGRFIMQKNIDISKGPSQEQIEMLAKAAKISIHDEAESPEFSEIELQQFKKISGERRADRQKQTVTLRLSPQALERARSLGKGYTSVLSRILEKALADPNLIKQNL